MFDGTATIKNRIAFIGNIAGDNDASGEVCGAYGVLSAGNSIGAFISTESVYRDTLVCIIAFSMSRTTGTASEYCVTGIDSGTGYLYAGTRTIAFQVHRIRGRLRGISGKT